MNKIYYNFNINKINDKIEKIIFIIKKKKNI